MAGRRDMQQAEPEAYCNICGDELYGPGEYLVYDGRNICRSCFLYFAADYFGAELAAANIGRDEMIDTC